MNTKAIRNTLTVILILAVIVAIAGVQANATTSVKSATGYVNSSDGLNLRAGASQNSKAIKLLNNNTKVTITREVFTSKTSTSIDKKWYYVTAAGKTGYVAAKYVDGIKYQTVSGTTTDVINIRKGPGTKMATAGSMEKGRSVTVYLSAKVTGNDLRWYKIKSGSSYYYVCADYVKLGSTPAKAPTKTTPSVTKKTETKKPETKAQIKKKAALSTVTIKTDSSPTKPKDASKDTVVTDTTVAPAPAPEKNTTKVPATVSAAQQKRARAFLDACDSMGKDLVAKKFKYGGGASNNYDAAVKSGNKKTDCAVYVSWAMQRAGLLASNKKIWLNNKIHGSGTDAVKSSDKLSVYYPSVVPSKSNLQPGDICGFKFSGTQHTMVYAGRNSAGKMVWYSGGGTEIKNKKFGPVVKNSYDKRKVYVLIRVK